MNIAKLVALCAGQVVPVTMPPETQSPDLGDRENTARAQEESKPYSSPAAAHAFSEHGTVTVHQAGANTRNLLVCDLSAQNSFTVEWDSQQLPDGACVWLIHKSIGLVLSQRGLQQDA